MFELKKCFYPLHVFMYLKVTTEKGRSSNMKQFQLKKVPLASMDPWGLIPKHNKIKKALDRERK